MCTRKEPIENFETIMHIVLFVQIKMFFILFDFVKFYFMKWRDKKQYLLGVRLYNFTAICWLKLTKM